MNKNGAINLCKEKLIKWPSSLSVLSPVEGWVWERSRLPFDKLATVYLTRIEINDLITNDLIIRESDVFSEFMNKSEAIEWCNDFLPEWPNLINTNGIGTWARPKGWNWMFTDECITLVRQGMYVFKDDVFPPATPKPVLIHVIEFLANIEVSKKREPEYRIITTDRKTFDKLATDMGDFIANESGTQGNYDGVKIVVLNPDINIISGFLSEHSSCFSKFLESQGRGEDFDSIINTLINTDD